MQACSSELVGCGQREHSTRPLAGVLVYVHGKFMSVLPHVEKNTREWSKNKTEGKARGVSEQQTTTMQGTVGLVTQVVGINFDKQVRTVGHCIDASRRYSSAKSKQGRRGAR